MTWNEITKAYPDKWVAVANSVMYGDSPDILEGDIVAVMNDDDIDSYKLNHHGKGYKYRRTTEGFFNGITGSSITISVTNVSARQNTGSRHREFSCFYHIQSAEKMEKFNND